MLRERRGPRGPPPTRLRYMSASNVPSSDTDTSSDSENGDDDIHISDVDNLEHVDTIEPNDNDQSLEEPQPPIKPLVKLYAYLVGIISIAVYVLSSLGYITFIAESLASGGKFAWSAMTNEKRTRQRLIISGLEFLLEGDWTWSGLFQSLLDGWMGECSLLASVVILGRYTPVVGGLKAIWTKLTKVDSEITPDPIYDLSVGVGSRPSRQVNRRRHGAAQAVSFDFNGDNPFFDEDDSFDSVDENGEGELDDDSDEQDIRIEELLGPNSPYHGLSLEQIIQRLEAAYGMANHPLDPGRINQFPLMSIQPRQAQAKLQCTICLVNFRLNELVKRLDCQHFFHTACIQRWFERTGTCPNCRFDYANTNANAVDGNGNGADGGIAN